MISAFLKAIAQLSDPAFRRVLVLGVFGALVTFVLLNVTVDWLLVKSQLFTTGWLDTAVDVLGGLGSFLLTLLLFPAVASMIIGVLLDDIVRAVEDRHYPDLPPARERPMLEDLATTARFAGKLIAVNLVALPLYLLLMWFGVGIVLYYVLNGYLVGREYWELVALRRLTAEQADALRRRRRLYLWVVGAGFTFLLSLPLVNLVAPMIATAIMVHVFQTLRRRDTAV